MLTQYEPLELNGYLGNGSAWDLDRNSGGVYVLPPYVKGSRGEWYSGTANAICQNIGFIERYSPEYVLILSGDHIYKMDYSAMLRHHMEKRADATIAVLQVPMAEAHRFGIMNTDAEDRIVEYGIQDMANIELAYATTIHKAMGSEYDIVILPIIRSHAIMLKRNLLYTAVSRARRRIILVGQKGMLFMAIHKNDTGQRNTLLGERIGKYLNAFTAEEQKKLKKVG